MVASASATSGREPRRSVRFSGTGGAGAGGTEAVARPEAAAPGGTAAGDPGPAAEDPIEAAAPGGTAAGAPGEPMAPGGGAVEGPGEASAPAASRPFAPSSPRSRFQWASPSRRPYSSAYSSPISARLRSPSMRAMRKCSLGPTLKELPVSASLIRWTVAAPSSSGSLSRTRGRSAGR